MRRRSRRISASPTCRWTCWARRGCCWRTPVRSKAAAAARTTLAFLRDESEFYNLTLVEQPNGDFGDTIVRQFLFDAWQLGLYEALRESRDATLAAVAAKGRGEAAYHLRYSSGWVVRLGDGTAESHARVADSLERLWPYTRELFRRRRGRSRDGRGRRWRAAVDTRALLSPRGSSGRWRKPRCTDRQSRHFTWYGKQGRHSEHLGFLLAEMQSLHRAHPGAHVVAAMGTQAQAATAPPPEVLARLQGILAQVVDPEIPVLSVLDLGIIRHLSIRPDGQTRGRTLAHVLRLSRKHRHQNRRAARAACCGLRCRGRRRAGTALEQRLAERGGAPQALGLRHCAAGCAARLSSLRLEEHDSHQRIRLHALQGATSLRRLPRAVRLFQVHIADRAC